MLPLVPAFVAITIVLTYVISIYNDTGGRDFPNVISENIMMHHADAVKTVMNASPGASSADRTTSRGGGIAGGSLRALGAYRTTFFEQDGRRYAMTWQEDRPALGGVTQIRDADYARAISDVNSKSSRLPGRTVAGPYTFLDTGGASVGPVSIGPVFVPFENGYPVILTVMAR